MTRILAVSSGEEAEVVAALRQVLAGGGVAGIPTDTVYGLAADPHSERGVNAIYEMKGRDAGKALPVLISGFGDLAGLGVILDARQEAFLRRYWPGPLTAVLRLHAAHLRAAVPASGGEQTLAVRLPGRPWLRTMLSFSGPVTATSANRSGHPPARTAAEVDSTLGSSLQLILDAGPAVETRPSTLVDLTTPSPVILREGPIFPDVTLF